jgi:hypothetical protein
METLKDDLSESEWVNSYDGLGAERTPTPDQAPAVLEPVPEEQEVCATRSLVMSPSVAANVFSRPRGAHSPSDWYLDQDEEDKDEVAKARALAEEEERREVRNREQEKRRRRAAKVIQKAVRNWIKRKKSGGRCCPLCSLSSFSTACRSACHAHVCCFSGPA